MQMNKEGQSKRVVPCDVVLVKFPGNSKARASRAPDDHNQKIHLLKYPLKSKGNKIRLQSFAGK
ncbi:hypothetical protein FRX31_023883 [Thalictrum thalictroides]|uniref:Uncharacterized protein n=1 Tax=Thalictrum thalictroides TaxID=46969 RepID=A0A7J6VP52_THATH|nr:hypothetical protein FRX31_023883 [Thalictrum thalictroides]